MELTVLRKKYLCITVPIARHRLLLFLLETVQEPLLGRHYISLGIHKGFIRSTVAADINRLVSAVRIISKLRSHLFPATLARQVFKTLYLLHLPVESNHSPLFRFFLHPMMLPHFKHINKTVECFDQRRQLMLEKDFTSYGFVKLQTHIHSPFYSLI